MGFRVLHVGLTVHLQINPHMILWIRASMRPDGLSWRDDDGHCTNSVTTTVCSHMLGYCAKPEDNQSTAAMTPKTFASSHTSMIKSTTY